MGVESYTITELDDSGHRRRILVDNNHASILDDSSLKNTGPGRHLMVFFTKVFLPSGYPNSVSPDYLRYQIFNALQAFCSSLAGLLSSRAILEGFGVGDPSATATYALFLTVLQDAFSRIITIFGAYIFGSSLVPETKTYRFLADILNDAGIILDTLSPALGSPNFIFPIPGLRVGALCLSASFKALCGISAGGSKAAITLHFASPLIGSGDVGDLNAKDASKETTLALLGMLLGTLIVPHLATPSLTYGATLTLVALHLTFNYLAVRGLELRSLNRQRVAVAWAAYRSSGSTQVLSPAQASKMESFLGRPDVFRDDKGHIIGRCVIGSAFSDVFRTRLPIRLLEIFEQERYILWYDDQCLYQSPNCDRQRVFRRGLHPVKVHILLKQGYTGTDQLKAWCHAAELCRLVVAALAATNPTEKRALPNGHGGGGSDGDDGDDNALAMIGAAHQTCVRGFDHFTKCLREALWNTDHIILMAGSPKAVLTGIEVRDKGNKKLY